MTCTCAPALLALRDELDTVYPQRDHRSDGCCASAAHTGQNPKSDHEPGRDGTAKGLARAYDVDEDLTPNGPGPDNLVGLLFHLYGATEADADPRCKQFIYEGFSYYPHDGARPRGRYEYHGINDHKQHLHISIFDWAVNLTTRWLPEGDDDLMALTEKEQRALAAFVQTGGPALKTVLDFARAAGGAHGALARIEAKQLEQDKRLAALEAK